MHLEELKHWRKAERKRLISARLALSATTLERFRCLIDEHLEREFPILFTAHVAFCWPINNEYDARPLAQRLRESDAVTALPVVRQHGQPLIFREWHPGIQLASGALGIPYPTDAREIQPTALLLPTNGWDNQGYRLGYGGGFFDRTLAKLTKRPMVIGIGYELARIDTIYPQSWDVPLDFVVTERGVYRRRANSLAFT